MYNSSILIERVSELCKEKNISINQMLKEANLSISVIDNIKRNRIPSIDKIDALATFFGCSVDYLIGRTNVPQICFGDVIHTGNINGSQNVNINFKNSSKNSSKSSSNDTSELLELIESLPLLKRAEAVIYLNSLKENWINIQNIVYLFNFRKIE